MELGTVCSATMPNTNDKNNGYDYKIIINVCTERDDANILDF